MQYPDLNVGVVHSLIGKNDGVSIVIDQMVNAMHQNMGIPLGNFHFLSAHSSSRFNSTTNEIFWHKNDIHKMIIKYFCDHNAYQLEQSIHENAERARDIIGKWVDANDIDVIIAHNISHPYNFITAVGLGLYREQCRKEGRDVPKVIAWWHDSYFERDIFDSPNAVIRKFLKYLPGVDLDGIVVINSEQVAFVGSFLYRHEKKNIDMYLRNRVTVIPNTTSIDWDWKSVDWDSDRLIAPPQDLYNDTFFYDTGVVEQLDQIGFKLEDAAILLQHTRVVNRKRIELAIELAFELSKKYREEGVKKCVVVLVAGHSGDEQELYKEFLLQYWERLWEQHVEDHVLLVFGEDHILSSRDIMVDRKFYRFMDVPSIVAAQGGIGTYFSEIEGYGNNLLEMMSMGLPVVINQYEVYKRDIAPLGFDLPSVDNCVLNQQLVDEAYALLNDMPRRNRAIHKNITILEEQLDHQKITDQLNPLFDVIFAE